MDRRRGKGWSMGEQRQETNNLDDSAVLESITSQWWSIRALLRLVSPLALEPVVPHERRAIFAGVVDRVVPPVQAHSLWRHWEQPRIGWYQGAHQRFIRAPKAVRSSKRPSAPPTCFPRRRQVPPLNARRSWRSRPGSSRRPAQACTHRARPLPVAASRASV